MALRPPFRLKRKPRQPAPPKTRDRVLVTPEGISLPVKVATRGARMGALVIDLLFIGLIMAGVSFALMSLLGGAGVAADRMKDGSLLGKAMMLIFIVWIVFMFLLRNAYFLFFELGARGATPGKRIAGIRIAARDGGRLSAEMVIARNLLRDIELFLPVLLVASAGVESGAAWLAATGWFAIFMLFPFFNRDALRAGDVVAGTWVLERPRHRLQPVLGAAVTAPSEAGETPAPERRRYDFTRAELAVYGEFELQTLERVLRESGDKALDSVYQTIARKIQRQDGWGDERAFLEDYYLQLRARLETGMRMGQRKADKYSDIS
ncbi:RDD family protein [Novosphingobium sp. 9]|uniref:RDD family protein n=1 Tax=Novosphingobium sp. 9 TaxID=2025349 RepID=UPI0021B5B08B|nr:RDD family protein [Novosphingobium sp. 9]